MSLVDPFGGDTPEITAESTDLTDPWEDELPTNPVSGLFGIVGNAWDEAKSMVGGVGQLIGAGVHDLGGLALEGVTLGQAETDYKLDDIAMALPGALAQDYGSRYGIRKFLDGDLWGGLSDLAHGIYEHPLSFAGDVLMVGGAAKVAAKAGMLGSEAGSLGAKVLGHVPGAAPAALEGMSLTSVGEAGGQLAMRLSENPVARMAQSKAYKLAQYGGRLDRFGSAESYVGKLEGIGDLNKYKTAATQLRAAQDAGLPVWRPALSRSIESRGVSRAFSIMGIEQKDRWVPAAQKMDGVMKVMRERLGESDWRSGQAVEDYLGTVQGTSAVIDAPDNIIPQGWSPHADLEAMAPDNAAIQATDLDVGVMSRISKAFGRKYGQTGGFQKLAPDAGLNPSSVGGDTNRIRAIVTDMDESATTAQAYAKALDGQIIAVDNTIGKVDSSYAGYNVKIATKADDGADAIVEVQIATPDLAEAQDMWSKLQGHVDTQQKLYDQLTEAVRDPMMDAASKAKTFGRMVESRGELEAARALNANTFDHLYRRINAGGDYNPILEAADRTRAVVFNNATWTEMKQGALTARKAMDRAFGPIRITKWGEGMRSLEQQITRILESGASGQDMIPLVYQAAEQLLGRGHKAIEDLFRSGRDWNIPFETDEGLRGVLRTGEKTIKSDEAWMPRGWRTDPAGAARRMVDDIRAATHKQFVENGESTGYTWKDLIAEQGSGPMPQYYPHIKSSRLASGSQVMQANRKTAVVESVGPREKKWGGWLYETGRYEKDAVKAYESLFREVARHAEFADMMQLLVKKFGRSINEAELAEFAEGGAAVGRGYVLVSQRGLTDFVSKRAQLMTLTHEGVMAGDNLSDATAKAVNALLERAKQDFLDSGHMADEVWALPEHVAKHIDRAAKLSFGQTFNFYYDTAMNMWKASVLSLSPRWVVNNTLGNLSYMGVAAPQAIKYFMGQMLPSRRALMRTILGDEFSGKLERDFIHGTMGDEAERLAARSRAANVQWGQDLAQRQIDVSTGFTGVGRAERLGWRGVGAVRWTSREIRSMNAWIEDAARRGVALESLRKQALLGWETRFLGTKKLLDRIAKNGIPEKHLWTDTVNDVNAVLGDYLVMSPLEQQIIRRYAMPFYAFYRHTAKFIAKMPFQHPLKMQMLQRIDEVGRELEGTMPEYMRGAVQISNGMWLNLARANPLAAVTEGYWPSITHPLAALAVQRATGTNPFGQPYQPGPEDGIIETASGTQMAIIRGPNGEFLGVRELSGTWEPPMYQSVLSMVPQFALLPGVDVFGRDFARKAAGLAGVPYTGFDLEKYRAWKLNDELEGYGRGANAAAQQAFTEGQ